MTTIIGSRPVKDNLVFNIDAASVSSLRGRKNNILTWDNWENDASGTVPSYNGYPSYVLNGSESENSRISTANPWGYQDRVWKAFSGVPGSADGGWTTSNFPVDPSKLYRFSVWVKGVVTSNAEFYLGMYGLNALGATQAVQYRDIALTTSNPYFMINNNYSLWDENTIGTWYLVVGHVWPAGTVQGTSSGDNHPTSGVWKLDGTNVAHTNGSHDFIWEPDTAFGIHRVYQYYSNTSNAEMHFYQPRVDLVDGSEPSLQDLLNNTGNLFKDVSGNNNNLRFSTIGSTGFGNGIQYHPEYYGYMDFNRSESPSLEDGSMLLENFSSPSSLSSANFLYNDHTMEIWARIQDFSAYGGSGETLSALMGYPGTNNAASLLSGFSYSQTSLLYTIWEGPSSRTTYGQISRPFSTLGHSEGEWHQYCVTVNNASGSMKLYIDGVYNWSASASGLSLETNSVAHESVSDQLSIAGARDQLVSGTPYNWFSETDVAIARMYTKELSATEVLQNFNASKGRFQL